MARFVLIIFVALFIVHYSIAKPSGGGKGRNRHRWNDVEIQQIKNRCEKDESLTCKGQKEEHKKKRHGVKNSILNSLMASGKSNADAEKEAEEQLQKTHELKIKIHEAMGISKYVEPANDGLFGGDMLLSKDHAQRLIDSLNETQSMSKRAIVLFLEPWPSDKWSMPIHYWINQTSFSSAQQTTIRDGIAILANSTKCLSFVEDDEPARGSQIQYGKQNPDTGCNALLGYLGAGRTNPVNLGNGCVYKSIVMHETIHALGGGHEQQRNDRDTYITYLKENVDPKYYDAYAQLGGDDYTMYGVGYSTSSVMHYGSFDFSVNKQPTMINKATNAPDIKAGEVLTQEDILQLNRMYCATCKDADVACSADALSGKCSVDSIKTRCPKSCGTCDV